MSDTNNFVVRRPRYKVIEGNTSRVWLENADSSFDARLVDFSRMGSQVELGVPLAVGEVFQLRIRVEASSLDIILPAVLRWQRPVGDGTWATGCEFQEEVAYEVVVELFLGGLLSTEEE